MAPITDFYIKKLYGNGYLAKNIKDQTIAIGGSLLDKDKKSYLKIDEEGIKTIINKLKYNYEKHLQYSDQLKEWLNKNSFDIDPKLYLALDIFTQYVEKKFGYPKTIEEIIKRKTKRKSFYQPKDQSKVSKLSEILENNAWECAEISALAQRYLEELRFDSYYVQGELLHNQNDEFSEPHSYIYLRNDKRNKNLNDDTNEYIFDPANPLSSSGYIFPNIRHVKNFKEKLENAKKPIFFATKSIYDKNNVKYYGISDGRNITFDIIVEE